MGRGASRIGEIVSLAHEAASAQVFERGLLALLGRVVGCDISMVSTKSGGDTTTVKGLETERRAVGLDDARFASMLAVGGRTYIEELAPVMRVALARRGVAVDTEVLGEAAARECSFHRDLKAPVGGKHSLLAFAQVRGRLSKLVILGRTGSAFRAREVAAVEELLPAISLALDSFARRGALDTSLLTPRERDVLQYLCLGYTNREVALACGSSPNTVRNQLAAIYAKLGASTRAEAVAIALSGAA
jgi:DNA-binding CsgD family transcriptional regulator